MQKPKSIKFDGVEYSIEDIIRNRKICGPIPEHWTRVKFKVPDAFESPGAIEQWLHQNCNGKWQTYHYHDPKSKRSERVMVVRFEEKNDAIFFKLRGGHQAWDTNSKEY